MRATIAWGLLCVLATAGCDAGKGGGPVAEPPPLAVPAGARHWDFEGEAVGQPPVGFRLPVGLWVVETGGADSDQAVVQRANGAEDDFNLLLSEDAVARDLELGVRLRTETGAVDQGGGVVWRARGPRDYYIARWNPLERNFRVYTVKDGVRRQLDSELVDIAPEAWHTLQVSMTGDHIECRLDGELLLDVRDTTFADSGAVGLWTKADAVTRFDDLLLDSRDG